MATTGTIDFNRSFGAKPAASASKGNGNTDRPKSRFWLNVGYSSGVKGEDGMERFVSLPSGIPLDGHQERLSTNTRNTDYAAFQAARNELLDEILVVAEKLEPGEEKLLNLQIQLRRVNDEAEVIPAAQNQFLASKPSILG